MVGGWSVATDRAYPESADRPMGQDGPSPVRRAGVLTVLFADLTGSTALYAEVGDAKAFALVQRRFGRLDACVRARGGAVLKTMGDAVLAVFGSPRDGFLAARDMV